MRYTPVELRHVRLSRSFFGGYKRAEADLMLADVADSFEDVWRERGELVDKLEEVEKRLEEFQQRENLLASTLVAAERAAVQAVESAKREAEVIVAEAHQESRSITRTAQNERERLFAEARRVETLLRAALGIVEETHGEGSPPSDEAVAEHGGWPNRENTREFEAVGDSAAGADQEPAAGDDAPALPPVLEGEDAADDIPRSGRDFAWG
ncbi:MAG: DivIVA domain-containing protein [Gaiellaceae bacterium]